MTLQISDHEPIAPGAFELSDELDHMMQVLGTFVLTHPRWRRAFPDTARQDVLYTLLTKLRDKHLTVLLTAERLVHGVIIYTPDPQTQTLHVEHILGVGRNILANFVAAWIKQFPGWRVVGLRRGKTKEYDFVEFSKHIFN